MSERISLKDVRLDGGTQPRVGIDSETVATYADLLLDGVKLPPVVVFYDGSNYWLADGFHRVQAFNRNAGSYIEADVRQGTKRDAVLYSVGANATHGKPRTNADKRRSVQTLLADEEWSQKSDRWIAEKACVGNNFVSRLRAEATTVLGAQLNKGRLGKDGKERALPRPKKSDPPAPAPEPPPSSKRQLTIEDVPPPAPANEDAVLRSMKTILAASQAAAAEQAKAAPKLFTPERVAAISEAFAPEPSRADVRSFADLLTRIAKLSSEDQASLACEVVEHLDAVHLHRVREVLDERTTPTRGPGCGSES